MSQGSRDMVRFVSRERDKDWPTIVLCDLLPLVSRYVLTQTVTFNRNPAEKTVEPSRGCFVWKCPTPRRYLYLPLVTPFGPLFDVRIDCSILAAQDILKGWAARWRMREGLKAFQDNVNESLRPGGRLYCKARSHFELFASEA